MSDLDKTVQIELFTKMLTIRRFEERVVQEFNAGNLPGVVHSYIGEEAIAVGVCAHLGIADRVNSHHRGHGHCIAKGADMKRMMAEIYGKKTGYCKGKGGSMHIADFKIGMLGADGIVGAGLPIAVGGALAAKLEGKGNVAVVFFGDGACQEGEFHESLNLAGIWKLPIIFVCENNLYGVNTHQEYALAAREISRMPKAYGISTTVEDGNDVEAVFHAAKNAVAHCRAGNGPSFLEFKTYRWHKHFLSAFLADLRPREELEKWKARCPVECYQEKLLKSAVLSQSEIESIDRKIKGQVEEAVAFALESPYPAPEDALADVFSA